MWYISFKRHIEILKKSKGTNTQCIQGIWSRLELHLSTAGACSDLGSQQYKSKQNQLKATEIYLQQINAYLDSGEFHFVCIFKNLQN